MSANASDIGIFVTITIMFLFIAIMLPIMENDMKGSTDVDADTSDITSGISDDNVDNNVLSGWDFLLSILGMFTWTFGALPQWLDIPFLALRVTWWYLFARLVRGV